MSEINSNHIRIERSAAKSEGIGKGMIPVDRRKLASRIPRKGDRSLSNRSHCFT